MNNYMATGKSGWPRV